MTTQNHAEDREVALSTLATTDPVLRDSAIFGLLVDAPGTVALRHDILEADGALRRVVVDSTGVLEDVRIPLDHACLSCTVREDAIPTLRRLAADGRWDGVLLALPVAAEPLAVNRALAHATHAGGSLEGLRLAATAAVVDVERLERDLLGTDVTAERGIALSEHDYRTVAEVVAAQLEHADVVITTGDDDPTGSGLLERVRASDSRRVDGLFAVSADDLAALSHDLERSERRAHPSGAPGEPGHPPVAGDRSWTLELRSSLPFHPERLLDRISHLGAGCLRSRGVFWVPNRPDSWCAWDGSGGQLHIGEVGPRPEGAHTRVVFVGVTVDGALDPRAELRTAFAESLTTSDEMADGGARWLGRTDVLEPWLGARSHLG